MTHSSRPNPLAAALTGSLLLGLVSCGHGPLPADTLPSAFEPDTPVRALTIASATRAQVYECRLEAGAAGQARVFVAPDAVLSDTARATWHPPPFVNPPPRTGQRV